MKKVLKVCLILFVSIFIPNNVKADCGILVYDGYKAKVSNINGAEVYESTSNGVYKKTGKKISYGTEVEISHDVGISGDTTLIAVNDGDDIVKASDLTNIKDFNGDKIKLEKSDYYTITDTEVRSGPGVLYDVVGTIKANTNIMIGDTSDLSEAGAWIKISDGTTTGYVYYEECYGKLPITIGEKVNSNNYYYLGGKSEVESKLNLKVGDKLNVKYVIPVNKGVGIYYIELNGKSEYLDGSVVGKAYNHKLIPIDLNDQHYAINLYDSNDKQVKLSDYLKINQEYNIKYIYDRGTWITYYIEINDKLYTLSYGPDYAEREAGEYPIVIADSKETVTWNGKDIEAYKLLNSDEGTTVYYNEELGLSKPESDEIKEMIKPEEETTDKEVTNEDDTITVDGLTSKDYVIICLIASLVIAVVAIVTLVVVNRKKNKINE